MSEADDVTTATTYELACTDCAFTARVDGSVYDALDEAEDHQDEHGGYSQDHFVNFQLSKARD